MNNNKSKVLIIVSVTVLVLVTLLAVHFRVPLKRDSYSIIVFGDSNVGNFRYEVGPVNLLGKKAVKKTFNAGIGGTSFNNAIDTENYESPFRYYSMVELSKAIRNDDFTIQFSEMPRYYIDYSEGNFDYIENTIKLLSKADISKTEAIFICHGLNDYLMGAAIDNPVDPYDTTSFGGAIRTIIENLQAVAPNTRIIFVGANYNNVNGDCETYSTGHGTLPEYLKLEEELAKEYNVEFTSMYGPINAENITTYTYDGMHYNVDGGELFSEVMYEAFLNEQKD